MDLVGLVELDPSVLACLYKWANDAITSMSCAESMDFGTPAIVFRIEGCGGLRTRVK